jgi:hypothetical protein
MRRKTLVGGQLDCSVSLNSIIYASLIHQERADLLGAAGNWMRTSRFDWTSHSTQACSACRQPAARIAGSYIPESNTSSAARRIVAQLPGQERRNTRVTT